MGQRIRIGMVSDFPEGRLRAVDADGTSVIVVRRGGELCAARNRCPHLGFSLTTGPGGLRYADGVVQCPWHNSRFEMCTGENLDWATGFAGRDVPRWSRGVVALGRRAAPLQTCAVVVDGEDVFIEV